MSTRHPVEPQGHEDDLREYLRPMWRRKWLIAAIVVIAGGGAFAVGKLHHKGTGARQYVGSTQVYIETADPRSMVGITPGTPEPPEEQQMGDIATLFKQQSITNAVYSELHMPVGSAGTVNAAPSTSGVAGAAGTSILDVSATSDSQHLATRLADTYVSVFLASRAASYASEASSQAAAYRQQLQLLPNTSANAQTRTQLTLDITTLEAEAHNPNAEAYEVAPATVSALPVSAPRSAATDGAIGAGIGLLLGIAVAFGLGLFDRRLLRVNAVEAAYGREVVGVLPHVANAAPASGGKPMIPVTLVEALRGLRISLQLSGRDRAPRTLLVTSAMPGEGKSTLARNLALVCAEGGERVLLIDADLRRPSMPRLLGVETPHGLTHVLRGEISPGNAVARVIVPAAAPGHAASANGHGPQAGSFDAPIAAGAAGALDVLTHGDLDDNPIVMFGSQAMETLLASAREQYDTVIVDSAPILAVTDSVPLLSKVDGVLIVARLGVTTRDAAARLNEMVGRIPDANILGVVANDLRDTFLDSSYGGMYSSRYGGYGYRDTSVEHEQPARLG